MWINSSETLPLSFLLYACFDPSLFVTKYAFLSERIWAIWNQVVLSTSIYWAFTVCYTLLGRDEAKIDEWIRVKLAESNRRALCAVFKTPLQRSHFSPSLPQEGFQIRLSSFPSTIYFILFYFHSTNIYWVVIINLEYSELRPESKKRHFKQKSCFWK